MIESTLKLTVLALALTLRTWHSVSSSDQIPSQPGHVETKTAVLNKRVAETRERRRGREREGEQEKEGDQRGGGEGGVGEVGERGDRERDREE